MPRLLEATTPPMNGEDVLYVQNVLRGLGSLSFSISDPEADDVLRRVQPTGVYDSATIVAVKRFQAVLHLGVDGEAGPKTWAMLEVAPQNLRAAWVASRCVGMREDVKGSDRIAFSRWWGLVGKWCAMFASWCWVQAGMVLCKGWKGKGKGSCLPDKGCDSVPTIVRWAQSIGIYMEAGGDYIPRTGDLVIFSLDGTGDPTHIGIAIRTWKGTLFCVEGNYSDAVCATHYGLDDDRIIGYVRM